MTRVVDVHNHSIPGGLVERVQAEGEAFGYRVVEADGKRRMLTPDGEHAFIRAPHEDDELRQRELAEAGIDLSLQSISPGLMSYNATEDQAAWFSRTLNNVLGDITATYPDRVSGMATVPLQNPKLAADELLRAVGDLGLRSVQISTSVAGENLDWPDLDTFWSAAQETGALIFVHPWYHSNKARLPRYFLQNIIGNPLETTIAMASVMYGGVLDRFPDLKFVFAHSGGYGPWIRGRWTHAQQVRPEAEQRARGASQSIDDYFKLIYVDTIIYDDLAFRYLVEAVGADHIMIGTDYPADMGNNRQQDLRSMTGLTDEQKDAILGGNALRLLGLPE